MRRIVLVRDSFPDPPSLGSAVARATLQHVANGRLPEILRVSRPARVLAFGGLDRASPGFARAVEHASAAGFAPVQRLAGGRAAVFHEDTIAFSWAIPDPEPRAGIRTRFEVASAVVADALRAVGADARIGPVPGEYCPGEHSVNARGRWKLMGLGQRVVAGGAHLGGVVVVAHGDLVRAALVPVYEALGFEWDPETAGSVEDDVPGITWPSVRDALVNAFSRRFDLEEGSLAPETIDLARHLAPEYSLAS